MTIARLAIAAAGILAIGTAAAVAAPSRTDVKAPGTAVKVKSGSTSVDAPGTKVRRDGRNVSVNAPYTTVTRSDRGIHVRAPYVNIYIPR